MLTFYVDWGVASAADRDLLLGDIADGGARIVCLASRQLTTLQIGRTFSVD